MKLDTPSLILAGLAVLDTATADPITIKFEGRRNAPFSPRLARTVKRSSPVNVELTDWFDQADFQVCICSDVMFDKYSADRQG